MPNMIDLDTLALAPAMDGLATAMGTVTKAVDGLATTASAAEQSIQRIVAAANQLGTQQKKADAAAGQQDAGDKDAENASDSKDAANKAANVAKSAVDAQTKAWNDLYNSVETGLSDSLYKAISSGKDVFDTLGKDIETWFKTTVLKLAIQTVVSLGLESLGIAPVAGIAAAGATSGAAAGAAGAASGGSSAVMGALSSVNFGVQTGVGMLLNGGGGASMEMALANLQGIGGASQLAGLGQLAGTVAIPVGVAALVANAFGAFRSETVTDTGISGTLGYKSNKLDAYTEIREGGTLFDGPSYNRIYTDYNQAQEQALGSLTDAAYDSITNYAKALGLNADAIKGYTKAIDLSFQGLTPAQAQAKVNAAVSSLSDTLVGKIAITGGKSVQQTTTNKVLTARTLSDMLNPLLTNAEGTTTESGTQGQLLPPDALQSLGAIVYATQGVRDLSADDVANYKAALASIKAAATDPDLIAGLDKAATALENSGKTVTTTITGIAAYAKGGETATQTLARLATSLQAVNASFAALGWTTQQLSASLDSADLASGLLDQFGGSATNLNAATSNFLQNFFTPAQQKQLATDALQTDFKAHGLSLDQFKDSSGNLSRDMYRDYAQGLDKSNQDQLWAYGYLLRMAPAFEQLSAALGDTASAAADTASATGTASAKSAQDIQIMQLSGDTAGALAAQRQNEMATMTASQRVLQQRIYDLQDEQAAIDALKKTASDAYDTLDRSVAAEKKSVDQAYQDNVDTTQAAIDGLTTSVQKLQSLADRLKSVLSGFATSSTFGMSQQEASAQIAAALAIARSSGTLPDVASLDDALTVISQPVSLGAKNAVQYLQQVDQQVALVSQLNALTDDQLSAQQTELQVQQEMLKTLAKTHDDDIARLDGILDQAKLQLDAVNGVNTSVLSVATALAAFNTAILAVGSQQAAGTGSSGLPPANTGGGIQAADDASLTDLITRAYEGSLGREPEQAGLQYYRDLVQSGAVMPDQVASLIAASPEAQQHAAGDGPVPVQMAVARYADGGFSSAGWAMVGEQGPELAHFGTPAQVFPAAKVKPMLAGSSDGVEQLLGQILARLTDDRSERNLQAKSAGQWRFEMLKRTKRIENNTGAAVPADEEETA